ncbi:MAG TPA: DUF4340 domain-containing protein [Candidatus Acidoferrum sp.]|nr:DUF4340 domain-containing protein [Candidatus Acidoferrum sp.]
MNQKQLVLLLVVVVALGAAGLWLYRSNQSDWKGAGKDTAPKLLGDLPINDVAAIVIKGGTNELDLVKKDNLWRVKQRDDYPANYSEISGFLLKAADLKAVQTDDVGPSMLGRYKLLPPGPASNTAVLVEFNDQNGKPLKTMLLGKSHMRKAEGRPSPMGDMEDSQGWPDGRYVMVGAGAKTVAVVSDPLSNIEAKPDQWLNKDFFKVEKIRSIAVTYPVASNSWKVARDTDSSNDWKLSEAKPGEQLDSSKTSGFSYALASPTFNDVLPADTKPAQVGLDKPTTLALQTFDNWTYTVNVGQKTNDNLPITVAISAEIPKERIPGKDEKPEDKAKLDKEFKDKQQKLEDRLAQDKAYEKRIYLVSNWTVDSLLKERSQLMQEKKEEPKKDEKSTASGTSTNLPPPSPLEPRAAAK